MKLDLQQLQFSKVIKLLLFKKVMGYFFTLPPSIVKVGTNAFHNILLVKLSAMGKFNTCQI